VRDDQRDVSSHPRFDRKGTGDSKDRPNRNGTTVAVVNVSTPQGAIQVPSFHHVHNHVVVVVVIWGMNLAKEHPTECDSTVAIPRLLALIRVRSGLRGGSDHTHHLKVHVFGV